jgi:hypothetical protein
MGSIWMWERTARRERRGENVGTKTSTGANQWCEIELKVRKTRKKPNALGSARWCYKPGEPHLSGVVVRPDGDDQPTKISKIDLFSRRAAIACMDLPRGIKSPLECSLWD